MNLQQAMQPKSSANGFGRRRAEREGGTRLENKILTGKSNSNRSSNAVAGGKVGVHESPSRDRLVYVLSYLMGHPVEVQLKDGSIYTGTCYTTNIEKEKEFEIVLKMARLVKDASFRGQKAEFLSKAPLKTLIVQGKDVVQVTAKDVSLTMDGMSNELQHEKQQDIMIDSFISQSRHVEAERELEPWVPDKDDLQHPELENTFDSPWNRGWDQFEANATLFGVKSTFNEELYTTKLERGPQMREREREATRIAREIEGEETRDLHLAEERGIHLHETFDMDEETRYSSVYRGRVVDDSGFEEVEDILLDSCNSETFGDTSASIIKKSADETDGKNDDRAQMLLASTSLDEAQYSESNVRPDLYHSGSHNHAKELASELPSTSISNADGESRIQENLHGEDGGHDRIKKFAEVQPAAEEAEFPKSDNSQLLHGKNDGSDKGLSPNATAYAPAHGFSKSLEKTAFPGEQSESSASAKAAEETQSVSSRGRPGSSTSSNSDCVGAASAPGGHGLSPSSSMGSLSSEKSMLNPHAKEFKLNPNAKSFTPSQTPLRPPSPVSDSSYYFPTNVPHMHGVPMGIGIGPSFTGHQPVIFNPQMAPLQTPQAYFHPGGPQYGQQMILSHPRQVVYMPGYQSEMPFKGREF